MAEKKKPAKKTKVKELLDELKGMKTLNTPRAKEVVFEILSSLNA